MPTEKPGHVGFSYKVLYIALQEHIGPHELAPGVKNVAPALKKCIHSERIEGLASGIEKGKNRLMADF